MNTILILACAFCGLFIFRNREIAGELCKGRIHPGDLFRHALLPAAGLAVFFVSVMGAGRFLFFNFFGGVGIPAPITFVIFFALGSAVFGFYLMALSMTSLLNRWSAGLFLIPAFLSGLLTLYLLWTRIDLRIGSLNLIETICAAWMVWSLGNSFLRTFAPSTEMDSVAYHLAIPKIWLKAKKMVYIPWIYQIGFPFHQGMFNQAAILFKMDTVSQGIHWLYGVMTASLILSWQVFEPMSMTARWFAAACFVSLPIVNHSSSTAKNDISWSFYMFLSSYLILINVPSAGLTHAALAGIFAGTASSGKYQGPYLTLVAGLAGLWCGRLNFNQFMVYEAVAVLVASPWYIRNWIWTKNPVWPLFYPLIGGLNWSLKQHRKFLKINSRNPLAVREWFDFPVWQIWRPTAAHEAAHYFLIPLLVLALVGPGFWIRHDFVFLGIMALFYAPIMLNLEGIWWRLLMPVIPSACLALGWLFVESSSGSDGWVRTVSWSAWMVFVPSLWLRFRQVPLTLFGVRTSQGGGLDSREEFLSRYVDVYPMFRWINGNLSQDAKILLFNELRGYYLDRDYMWACTINQGVILYENMTRFEQLRDRASECGITHVLVNESGPAYYRCGLPSLDPDAVQLMRQLVKENGREIHRENETALYELAASPALRNSPEKVKVTS